MRCKALKRERRMSEQIDETYYFQLSNPSEGDFLRMPSYLLLEFNILRCQVYSSVSRIAFVVKRLVL